ncbi:Prostacyclin synthase [Lachnellula subtilissima]|uniref:Prostacyclin synthase n=1 Tax=Lachnellula subtilissima TaxID=602034 RepID=A0A8H8RI87_9HELO|nr:Prostacyclin synthase [Lachnellula subtilissima]
MARKLYSWNGVSPSSMKTIFAEFPPEKQAMNHRAKNANDMIQEYHRQQLYPGDNFQNLMIDNVLPKIHTSLTWDTMSRHPASRSSTPESITLSLLHWTSDMFISQLIEIYWGKKISIINPELLRANLVWEKSTWKYIYRIPKTFANENYEARKQINDTLEEYFKLPREERKDANFFVEAMEKELRGSGLNDVEVARVSMLHLWAITGNNFKLAFWTIAYIIHDPELHAAVLAEIKPGVLEGVANMDYLKSECPLLEAILNEVLRVTMASALVRDVIVPTIIDGKILHRGDKLLIPYRQLHFNQDIWGANANEFDPSRFIRDKSLGTNASYRPFGGGPGICPGRHMARQAMYATVALLFTQFDVSLAGESEGIMGKQQFPRMNETKPPLGTIPPMEGEDVILLLRRTK